MTKKSRWLNTSIATMAATMVGVGAGQRAPEAATVAPKMLPHNSPKARHPPVARGRGPAPRPLDVALRRSPRTSWSMGSPIHLTQSGQSESGRETLNPTYSYFLEQPHIVFPFSTSKIFEKLQKCGILVCCNEFFFFGFFIRRALHPSLELVENLLH